MKDLLRPFYVLHTLTRRKQEILAWNYQGCDAVVVRFFFCFVKLRYFFLWRSKVRLFLATPLTFFLGRFFLGKGTVLCQNKPEKSPVQHNKVRTTRNILMMRVMREMVRDPSDSELVKFQFLWFQATKPA